MPQRSPRGGPSVSLRACRESDLPIFFEHQADPVAYEMAGFPTRDRNAFESHWREKVLADASVYKSTVLVDGVVAGNLVCFLHSGRREIGYWIGREFWGRGVATEAVRRFLERVPDRPLYAGVVEHNTGSIRVLEKCGFRRVEDSSSPDATQSAEAAGSSDATGSSSETELVFRLDATADASSRGRPESPP